MYVGGTNIYWCYMKVWVSWLDNRKQSQDIENRISAEMACRNWFKMYNKRNKLSDMQLFEKKCSCHVNCIFGNCSRNVCPL